MPNPMLPVVRLDAKVIQIREVPAGTGVGYAHVYVCGAPTRIATLAIGYADGLFRSLVGRGRVYAGGTALPILGRVSMDSVSVDATALPEGRLAPGATVEVIGPHQSVDELADRAGTISYEILTSLGRRFHRVHVAAETPAG